ncbi:ASCH domain-containing protein [Arenibacter sp. GZD96]|uniref:ASCH domain-containing protein n=1 Tax=Aurantibrevibacter litoralis TaxID=3106030 RepID=UPI002AFF370F|nr:ASCH domain-containing protein [Arenibacter sp. GZD-96]MEA1787613.1 ASCH domain-containing protein [Arenibacter sp. GZD-96]
MENNHSAKNMWGDYLDAHLEHAFAEAPKIVKLGDSEIQANTAVSLVVKGIKKASSSSLLGLQYRKQSLPKIGDFVVFTNWDDQAQCIARITTVKLKPFFSIDADFARLEGEGDKSLAYWKQLYWDIFTRELEPFGRVPRESMIVVCQTFEKVF